MSTDRLYVSSGQPRREVGLDWRLTGITGDLEMPSASIFTASPSRRTRALFFIILVSASRLAGAFDSCRLPSTT
jgi:hypothetical protein